MVSGSVRCPWGTEKPIVLADEAWYAEGRTPPHSLHRLIQGCIAGPAGSGLALFRMGDGLASPWAGQGIDKSVKLGYSIINNGWVDRVSSLPHRN